MRPGFSIVAAGVLCGLSACGAPMPVGPSAPPVTTAPPAQPPAPLVVGSVAVWIEAEGRARPVEGATVAVLEGADTGRSMTTGKNGEFVLKDLRAGRLSLAASYGGFSDEMATFDLTASGHGQTFVLMPVGLAIPRIAIGEQHSDTVAGNEAPCSGSGDVLLLEGGMTGPCKRFTLFVPQDGSLAVTLDWTDRHQFFDLAVAGQRIYVAGGSSKFMQVRAGRGPLEIGVAIHGVVAGPQPFTLTTKFEAFQ